MFRRGIGLGTIACAVCATIACSPSRTEAAATPGGGPANASASGSADTTVAAGIDCNKVFSPSDVAGLLMPPVTVTPVPGGTWCAFVNDFGGDITVSVGSDRSVEMMWNDATRTTDSIRFAPIQGVGDRAVFAAGTDALNPDLASQKGKMYCNVAYDLGTSDHYKKFKSVGSPEIGKKLGTLCNKAFAAVRA